MDAPGAQRLRLPHHGRPDGCAHVSDRTRHSRRAAAGAAPGRVGASGAVGPRRHRRTAGVGRRAVAPLDRARHARHPVREACGVYPRLSRGAQHGTGRTGRGGCGERHVHRAQPDRAGRRNADAGAGRGARAGDAPDRRRTRRRDGVVDGRRARDRRPHRSADHQGRGQRRPRGATNHRGHPGVPVRQLRDRRRERARQPHPRRGRDVAQLPEAARSR